MSNLTIKRFLSVILAFTAVICCVTASAADMTREVYETDINPMVCINAEGTGVYLDVEGPVDSTVTYAEGDFIEDTVTEPIWLSECPSFSDYDVHTVTVKVSGDAYIDTLFTFDISIEDASKIVSAEYDKTKKSLILTSDDPLLQKAHVINAVYDSQGLLTSVKMWETEFTNNVGTISDIDLESGKLFVWKSFNGAGSLFPLCETVNVSDLLK